MLLHFRTDLLEMMWNKANCRTQKSRRFLHNGKETPTRVEPSLSFSFPNMGGVVVSVAAAPHHTLDPDGRQTLSTRAGLDHTPGQGHGLWPALRRSDSEKTMDCSERQVLYRMPEQMLVDRHHDAGGLNHGVGFLAYSQA